MVSVSADVLESCGVTIVEVDTNNLAPIVGCSALNIDVSLALRVALLRCLYVSIELICVLV